MNKALGIMLLAVIAASPARAATWKIDAAHSAVTFRVAHLTISKVQGRFDRFSGSVEYEPGQPQLVRAEAVIETASVNTNVEKRDEHLRGADFFNVEKFPTMTFKSTKALGGKGMKGKLQGELTLRGVTKPVVLDVEGFGPIKDPQGNERLGATAKTRIQRKDFGMVFNHTLDTGGLMVGDEVEVTLELECIKESPASGKK
ncbi:MAG: hypothetical protein A2X36_09745 [Elusimicrobia bacterium GWA2_69_24]|nr:MAG: hypothetical protein A2X36_09745 [Elusimicrobia bacterium GWA2_69_24]HBL16447.1 protein yceI precursor [Elusimicrobiota bacterium]